MEGEKKDLESCPGSSQESMGNDLGFDAVDLVDVQVWGLSASTGRSKSSPWASIAAARSRLMPERRDVPEKTILKDVSAYMPSGSLTAIMGGSGSGKTTLLDVLSQRIREGPLHLSGSVTYNKHKDLLCTGTTGAGRGAAYVMQQDVLLPSLTVRETLQYAADLRLPPSTTKKERERVVDDVITELGLKLCADTRIGQNSYGGCSGGERRRTSIGVQLLANQSVLFLDEPTTGLDATSAFQVVQTLKNLAKKGRTIIITIHQPRVEIWSLLDHLVLLATGSVVYSGSVVKCLPYFEQMGHKLPAFVNPGEFLVDLAAVDTRSQELETLSVARVDALLKAWRMQQSHGFEKVVENSVSEQVLARPREGAALQRISALIREIHTLTRRTWKVTCRDRLGVLASIVEAVAMGVMTGWIFFRLGTDLAGIRSREGALYSASALQGYLVLLFETYRLTTDIEVFDRERSEGVVSVTGFVFSRRMARLLTEDLPVPLLYSVILYFMAGFRSNPGQFFNFFAVVLLLQYIAVNLAIVCVAISRNFLTASLIANLVYTWQSLSSGFFVNVENLAIWLRWTKWTGYVHYAFGALCSNEFAGQFYDCPSSNEPTAVPCKEYTGTYILALLGLPENWIVRPILALLCFAIAFNVLGILILYLKDKEMKISRVQITATDGSAGKLQITARPINEARTVTIRLDQCALDIEKRSLPRQIVRKAIFKPITATFEPGVLNVIMGPSGSGKTSLLNFMAQRLKGTLGTTYCSSGKMLFNGSVASESIIRSICSYVPQDDDGLLPSLTVRETLRFAALLRLPSRMSKAEKVRRAESMLLKLGLKDCADTLIGSEYIKGISGGERRRVTIAVQILTDPRILFLDEPTSGLDAFTSSTIIDVLEGLAEEGRTIIFTIHQSRSDLFKRFGSVLLLASSGDIAYSGPTSKMLPYFESLGFACAETTNPADFVLDLITADLHNAGTLILSRTTIPLRECVQDDSQVLALGMLGRKRSSFCTALPILIHRGIINLRRQPNLVSGRISQLLGLGIVITAFWAPIGNDYYSVQSRMGHILQISSSYFVGMLNSIAMFPYERAIFYKEDDDNTYPLEAFFLYYLALEIPMELIASILFSLLTVIACGLPRTPSLFFLMAYNAFCVISCGESLGIIFLTIFSHTGLAVSIMSVVLAISMHLGGILSLSVPAFLQALNYASPVKWQVGSLASYSLHSINFTCTDFQRLPDGHCPIEDGKQVLALYGLDVNTRTYTIALSIVTVSYRILAYLVLKARRTYWKDFFRR